MLTLQGQSAAPSSVPTNHVSIYFDTASQFLSTKTSAGVVQPLTKPDPLQAIGSVAHATTSTAYVAINDMTLSLTAGTWFVLYGGSLGVAASQADLFYVSLFKDGVVMQETERRFHNMSSHTHTLTQMGNTYTKVVVTGTTPVIITARFRSAGGNTLTAYDRTLNAFAIG